MKPVIFFDWDGLIADSMQLCVSEIETALTRMGLPVPPEAVRRRCNGPSYEETVAILNIPAERAQEYMALRLQAGLELIPTVNKLYPGMRELLLSLKDRAMLCIVSNGEAAYLEKCLRVFELEGVFAHVCSARPGRTKTQNLAELIERIRPERAVMVGDRLGDILAGKNNGLPTVVACYGFGTEEEWVQADRQAKTVAELGEVLEAFIAGRA